MKNTRVDILRIAMAGLPQHREIVLMKNNIFEFATGELSQDAFICWCLNWFNDDSKPILREMSEELIKRFAGVDKIKSVTILRQFSKDVYIAGEKTALKIDVLLVVNGRIAVIVEDKVYTSEHDNQIQRYADGIRYLSESEKENQSFCNVDSIRTVYLKTGFMYDEDKCVNSDVSVSGQEFLDILSKYSGNSEILDSYIDYLKNLLQWYADFGKYEGDNGSFWEWNIVKHQIAQYKLMRDIFSEELWKDRQSWQYRVYHGSSYGRPWTEMQVCERCYNNSSEYYSVFWRIDTNNDGPYISLRLYEDYDKKSEEKKKRHRDLYEAMLNIAKSIVDNSEYVWDEVYPGYKGNYKESSLIHICLKDKLINWKNVQGDFVNSLNELSNSFVEESSKLEF